MDILITIVLFVIVLGGLVLVHEIGHFVMAKLFKVKVEEFGIGFPPKLFGKKVGDVEYTLNAIPVGGFVRIKGVAGDERFKDNPSLESDSFMTQKLWKRFLILFAGIFVNFGVGTMIFIILLWTGLRIPTELAKNDPFASIQSRGLSVVSVNVDSPAQQAHLEASDVILEVNETAVSTVEEFQTQLASYEQHAVRLTIERGGDEQQIEVVPQRIRAEDKEIIGIGVSMVETAVVKYGIFSGFLFGLQYSITLVINIVATLSQLIAQLIVPQESAAPLADQLTGPLGIAVMTRDFAQAGLPVLFQFMAVLSLNLAVLNLLPIPMLDGGRIVFLIIEAIQRKPVSQKTEMVVHQIGFLLIFGLLIFVTVKDIGRLF